MNPSESNSHSTALDSDDQQIGSLYGKAILGAAGADVDEIVHQLNAIVAECLNVHPSLERVLESPRVSQADKEQLIDRVFGGRIHSTLLNFLKVLCRRNRVGSLRSIQISANAMRDQQLGRVRAEIASAFELTDVQREQIRSELGKKLGKQIVLDERVDDRLIGGIKIRIGDQVFDGSVMGKMSAIRAAVTSGIQKAVRDQFSSLLSS